MPLRIGGRQVAAPDGAATVVATRATATAQGRVPVVAGSSGSRLGWQLTTSNVGLAGVGVNRNTLPTYTGPSQVPQGTTISLQKITVPLDLYAGNITLDRCWVAPTSFGSPVFAMLSTIRDVGGNNTQSPVGGVVVQDCDIDATHMPTNIETASSCAFAGIGTVRRNLCTGMGTGFAFIVTGGTLSGVVEENYITNLRGFGDPATTGSHNEAATIRDFPNASGRSFTIRGNRFDCSTGANDTGGFFIQPLWGAIWNVTLADNYFEGGGWNLYAENHSGNTYGNVAVTNNRFRPTGAGAVAVVSGPGFSPYTDNYLYHATNPGNQGAPVFQ